MTPLFFLDQDHFSPDSMGPKMESAIKFIEAGGKKTIITDFKGLILALSGKTGTIISG